MQLNPSPTISNVGGKAYQLYHLKEICNVPDFFVVSFDNPEEIFDKKNQQIIYNHCISQKFELMAVRSSANCEDSSESSFAGMFKSILGVRPDGLIEAIEEVLDSVIADRVKGYCQVNGIDFSKIKMSVIVQKMVDSRVSGVCFTRMNDRNDNLIIEACLGLGELLVSGQVKPDTYILDRETCLILEESIGYQKFRQKLSVNNNSLYEEIPFYKRNSRKLSDEEIKKIAKASILIEKQLGFYSADVEWSFEMDNFYILQARSYFLRSIC